MVRRTEHDEHVSLEACNARSAVGTNPTALFGVLGDTNPHPRVFSSACSEFPLPFLSSSQHLIGSALLPGTPSEHQCSLSG